MHTLKLLYRNFIEQLAGKLPIHRENLFSAIGFWITSKSNAKTCKIMHA